MKAMVCSIDITKQTYFKHTSGGILPPVGSSYELRTKLPPQVPSITGFDAQCQPISESIIAFHTYKPSPTNDEESKNLRPT